MASGERPACGFADAFRFEPRDVTQLRLLVQPAQGVARQPRRARQEVALP